MDQKEEHKKATTPEVLAAKMDAQAGMRRGPRDTLIVVQRFKDYVAAKSQMRVADAVFAPLSDHVREVLNRAVVLSKSDGRKTLLDRDMVPVVKPRRSEVLHKDADEAGMPQEVLLVVSKLKEYVKVAHGLSTSDGILAPLSAHLRRIATESIRNAAKDERKTVAQRDVQLAVDAYFAS